MAYRNKDLVDEITIKLELMNAGGNLDDGLFNPVELTVTLKAGDM